MDGISVAHSGKHRKAPKVLHHLEIHPAMGGGHRIEAHHTEGYVHPVESKEFGADDHEGFYKHIAKHTGRPHENLEEQGGSEPEPYE